MNDTTFTEKYFLEEIHRFRDAFGTKGFFDKDEEHHDRMIKGLAFVYTNIVNEDGSQPTHEQIEKWANIFSMTLEEYHRRKSFLLMLPLKRMLGLSK